MDITIEGFHSWMWKGLTFLLPFLIGGYVYQAFNSYTLYNLSKHPDAPWQVSVLSILFLVLFIGNTWTTIMIIPQKLHGQIKERYRLKSMSWAMKIRQQIKVKLLSRLTLEFEQNLTAFWNSNWKNFKFWILQFRCILNFTKPLYFEFYKTENYAISNHWKYFLPIQGEKAEKIRMSESQDDGYMEPETAKTK